MSFFVPLDATFKNYLMDRTAPRYWKLVVDPNGTPVDLTAYIEGNSLKGGFTGEYSKWSAILNNSTGVFSEGDYAGYEVQVQAKAGSSSWFTVFTGYVDDDGLSRAYGRIGDDFVTIDMHDHIKTKGTRRKPASAIWGGFTISDTTTPAESILHSLAAYLGVESSDVDADDISQTLTVVEVGGSTAWQELKNLAEMFLAKMYFRYDGMFRFVSRYSDAYSSPASEWVFSANPARAEAAGESLVNGDIGVVKNAVTCNRATCEYNEYEHLAEQVVFQNLDDYDSSTEQIAIEVAAGEYYPGGASAVDKAVLSYKDPTTGESYDLADSIVTPTIGATGDGKDIECTGGTLTLTSFNGSTSATELQAGASEIILYNGTGSTITITKLQIRGCPYKATAKTIKDIDPAVSDEVEYVDETVDGTYATGETQVSATLQAMVEFGKERRRGWTFSVDWCPGIQYGAVVTVVDTDGTEYSATVESYTHQAFGKTGMQTAVELLEYGEPAGARTLPVATIANPDPLSATLDTINTTLDNMAEDSVITPQEKINYLTLWYQINGDGADTGSYWTVKSQAAALGISTTALTAAYDALYAYLFTSPAVLGTIPGENVTIVPASWLAVWAEYYSAEREIQSAVNQSAIQPSQEGLEVYYSFDGPEVDGQTVDNSGNYIHADVDGPTQVDSAQGLAYDFDGTDDSILTGTLPEIPATGITLFAHTKPGTLTDTTVGDVILARDGVNVYLSITDAGTIRFSFLDDSSNQRVLTYAAGIIAGSEHTIEAKHDGTTASIILDGVIVNADDTYALGATSTGAWRIGAESSSLSYPWDGIIDEVAIWSRALSYREDLGLWRVGGVQVKRYQSADETTLSVDGDAIVSQSGDGLQDMRLDLSMLRFRSRVSGSAPWEEQAWMKKREDSSLFDLSASGYGYGRSGLLSNIGMIWLNKTQPFTTNTIRAVAYGNGIFVAVGYNGTIARSTDYGETWGSLLSTPFGTSGISAIAYGNGVFIATGASGKIARSTDDGATWGSLITNPFSGAIYGLAYGNGVWVAVGDNGKIARSTDNGVTWGSYITNPFGSYPVRAVAYGNGVFVAVGGTYGTDGVLARSTDDGATWGSLITEPFGTKSIYSVAYGNGVFVAVGADGEIARSVDDGATWGSLITNPFSTSAIYGIAYGDGVFVAAGYSGKIARSTDGGISWVQQTYSVSDILNPFGTDGYFYSVAYGEGRFVSVGYLYSDSSGILCVSEWQEAGSGIVERGENSNGSYIKFSDGTMICWADKSESVACTTSSAYGGYYRTSSSNTFPAEFVAAPKIVPYVNSNLFGITMYSKSATAATFTLRTIPSSADTTRGYGYIAVGRWK